VLVLGRFAGALMIVFSEPVPTRVRLLLMVSCSLYVPGSTFIVSPGLAASIADWILGYHLERFSKRKH
jgi:hypothetical protein